MGIVKTEILSTELSDGQQIEIEYNENGRVHLHVDNIRIEMTKNEFKKFKEVMGKSRLEMNEYK